MKKLCFLLISTLLGLQVSFAQSGSSKKDDVALIKSRPLIVVVEEPKEELLKKLKEDEKSFYTSEIEAYNTLMKTMFPKYWKFNEKIEFKTRTEVNQLVKSKSEAYAYLEYSKFRVNFANPMGLKATRNLKDGKFALVGDYEETCLEVRLCENNPLGVPVYGVYMPTVSPTAGEMVYGLKQLQLQLNRKLEGLKDMGINGLFRENAKNAQKMTLLIDKECLNIEESEVSKYYPYKYELVDQARIDKAFTDEESDKFTFVFIPRTGGNVSTMVVETLDGKEMGRTSNDRNTGVSISTVQIEKIRKETTKGTIRKDDLKIIARQAKD